MKNRKNLFSFLINTLQINSTKYVARDYETALTWFWHFDILCRHKKLDGQRNRSFVFIIFISSKLQITFVNTLSISMLMFYVEPFQCHSYEKNWNCRFSFEFCSSEKAYYLFSCAMLEPKMDYFLILINLS